jgi:hypothetical protein
MPLRTIEGIQQALSASGNSKAVYVLFGIALLAVLAGLTYFLVVLVRRQNRLQGAWQDLGHRMTQWKLSREEQDLVLELATRVSPWSPVDVLDSAQTFERAVHEHLKEAAVRGQAARAAAAVRAVRTKLQLTHLRGTAYYSTRELPPGVELELTVRDSEGYPPLRAVVKGGREDLLELVRLEPADGGLKGRKVEVCIFERDCALRFEAQVVAVDAPKATCLLTHSVNLSPAGLREFHRVSVGKPVTFRAAWETPEVSREGALEDMSGGGLAVRCPCYYETGEQLVFQIRPALWLPEDEERPQKPLEDREVMGTIVNTRMMDGGRCVHHVEFRDLPEADREYVLALVRRLEIATAEQPKR